MLEIEVFPLFSLQDLVRGKLVDYKCMPGWRNWYTCLPAGRRAGLKKMYYVYAISSLTKNYIYVGLTDNLSRRVLQHNSARSKTTRPYAPFKLIYQEGFEARAEARAREKYLKSGVGKEYLKSL